jgi:hypothetical protein
VSETCVPEFSEGTDVPDTEFLLARIDDSLATTRELLQFPAGLDPDEAWRFGKVFVEA